MGDIRVVASIEELMKWREEVIEHVFGQRMDHLLAEANKKYFETHVPKGLHLALVYSEGGIDCGCGAICFSDELPSPDNRSGKCAYIMNIYVRQAFRKRGIAHQLVRRLIDEAKAKGCGKIYLETTAEARPVYLSSGFRDMRDLMKYYG